MTKKIEKEKKEKKEKAKSITFLMLSSEKTRSEKTLSAYPKLEDALISSKLANVRPNSIHIETYLRRVLPIKLKNIDFQNWNIEISIGRKVKTNSCKITQVDTNKKVLTLGVGQLQTSYNKLPSLASLLKAIIETFFVGVTYTDSEGDTKTFKGRLELPSGADRNKKRNSLILNELGVSEFSGMSSSAILTSFKCSKCNNTYVACNAPERDKACNIPNCSGTLKSTRLNYNHRSDNLLKKGSKSGHWGVTEETILNGLNPNDPAIKYSRGKVKALIFEYMNWDADSNKSNEELEEGRLVSQGVSKTEAKLVINTMKRAERKLAFKDYLDTLEKEVFVNSDTKRSKLHQLKKPEVMKLADYLKVQYDNELSGSDIAMMILNG